METHNWHDALDAQQDLYKFHTSPVGRKFTASFLYSLAKQRGLVPEGQELRDPFVYEVFNALAKNMIEAIEQAECCFVSEDILDIAIQAADDLPDDFIPTEHDFIVPCGFAYFERPLVGVDLNNDSFVVNGFIWQLSVVPETKEPVVQVAFFTDESDPRDTYGKMHLEMMKKDGITAKFVVSHTETLFLEKPFKWDKPELMKNASGEIVEVSQESYNFTHSLMKLVVAVNLLAEQHVSERTTQTPPRFVRKRAERIWREHRDFDIHVITLRRKRHKHEKLDGEHSIEYTTRWMVSGHWRRQWYPSRKKHQWKYIHSYVKGPEGLPIKKSSKRVFNFVR